MASHSGSTSASDLAASRHATIAERRGSRRATLSRCGRSFGEPGWGGPYQPEGDEPHRYVFALYAGGERLDLDQGSSPDEVRERLAEHALARGVLTGVYARGD
jgi:phosphatidylethanolamine-binding protein (PEBP) family uncharacterized protein